MGKPAETDRRHLKSLSHSFTLDYVVVCRSKAAAERALELIWQIMEKLKLTLHPNKTRLVDLGREGFEFLGFHFHKRTDRRTGKVLPYFWPGQKAMKTVRSKIRQLTGYSRKRVPMAKIVNDLNLVIRGWRNYFSVGNYDQAAESHGSLRLASDTQIVPGAPR